MSILTPQGMVGHLAALSSPDVGPENYLLLEGETAPLDGSPLSAITQTVPLDPIPEAELLEFFLEPANEIDSVELIDGPQWLITRIALLNSQKVQILAGLTPPTGVGLFGPFTLEVTSGSEVYTRDITFTVPAMTVNTFSHTNYQDFGIGLGFD